MLNSAIDNPLDNPMWYALNGMQSDVAQGNALAKRFIPEIGPLAGMPMQSEASHQALLQLAKPGEILTLFLEDPPHLSDQWSMVLGGTITQMVYEPTTLTTSVHEKASPKLEPKRTINDEIIELEYTDVPEMLALTQLTKPGPFEKHTIDLGLYVGIRVDGKLVAMAGERMHLPGLREVSAVCTHPDYTGRGYAQYLVSVVVQHILSQNEIPFLHAKTGNDHAIGVYEKLGFRQRRLLNVAVLRRN